MKKISIVYFTGSGTTEQYAKAIAKGTSTVDNVETNLISIKPEDIKNGQYKNQTVIQQLNESNTIIFGSPTYMGGVSAQFKAFADATSEVWIQQNWKDKFAAGFTISGAPSGDKLNTLHYLQALAMQHGMLWISTGENLAQTTGVNRLGSWAGAMAQSTHQENPISKEDLEYAITFGKRIASLSVKFLNN